MSQTKARDAARRAFGRQVSLWCAYDPEFAAQFSARDANGHRVIVPMLEVDTVAMACQLVRQAGGEGTLAVLHKPADARKGRGKKDLVLSTSFVTFSVTGEDPDGDCSVPVGSPCTLEDILRVLAPGSSITLRVDGEELFFDEKGAKDLPADGELAFA